MSVSWCQIFLLAGHLLRNSYGILVLHSTKHTLGYETTSVCAAKELT